MSTKAVCGICSLPVVGRFPHSNTECIRLLGEQAAGYRKALEQIRDQDNLGDFEVAFGRVQYIARDALSDAVRENPNAGHGWITGTADMDAIEGHAMREPVPEAGETPYLTIGEAAMIGKNAAEHALARACRERDAAKETIRQRDERIKSLAAALKPFHEVYVLYENALTLPRAEGHLQSVSSIHFAIASDIYESAAPPALCPTCKGKKFIKKSKQHPHGLERYPVPCPTCTEPT